jgi:hypothetical protein
LIVLDRSGERKIRLPQWATELPEEFGEEWQRGNSLKEINNHEIHERHENGRKRKRNTKRSVDAVIRRQRIESHNEVVDFLKRAIPLNHPFVSFVVLMCLGFSRRPEIIIRGGLRS